MKPLPSWHRVNINTQDALSTSYKWIYREPRFLPNFRVWTVESNKLFKKSWIEYVNSLGLELAYKSIIFYRPIGTTDQMAHIDLDANSTQDQIKSVPFAINWVIGGKHSQMHWYELPEGKMHVTKNAPSVYDVKWPIEQLTKIDSVEISDQATLVRVDLPHAITNDHEYRFCISVRFNLENYQWDDVVKHFEEKGLLL